MAVVASILQRMPEKEREKLDDKLTSNAISIIDSVGAIVGKFGERLRSDGRKFDLSFDDSSTDPECDFKYVKDLALFVNMAALAYKDESIAEQIPFVSKSQLIKDLKIETEVHICLLEDGSVAFVFRVEAAPPSAGIYEASNLGTDVVDSSASMEAEEEGGGPLGVAEVECVHDQ
ncbi:hypothetical protein L7F22_007524 [Adiantum nelumboides]|nr:hypothetical protein [Adiantum nelumboides]